MEAMEPAPEGLLDLKPNHLFRYASEWDPRVAGHTKGGYLEGKLVLPKDKENLRVVFSTVTDSPLNLEPEISRKFPESTEIHPTLLYCLRCSERKGQPPHD